MTMRLRFYRRVRVLPGVTINLGKRGLNSISFGRRGAHYTVGLDGHERLTIGLPGSGLYLTDRQPITKGENFSWLIVVLLLLIAVALVAFIN
jgi:hypothetical protein